MSLIKFIAGLGIFTLSSVAFANTANTMSDQSCAKVVKACIAAGYFKSQPSKSLWQDCMEPILLNKTVAGVSVSPEAVNGCRNKKIDELKNELKALEGVSRKSVYSK